MESEFERSFLDWSCEDVCSWLSTLALSKDYSPHFKVDLITGSTLVSLDREALDDMGITDDADRLKILQQITSMRADLVTSGSASPTRRIRTPMKGRRFSDATCPSHYPGGGRGPQGWRGAQGSKQNIRYVNVPIFAARTSESGASVINSPSRLSTDQTSSDSQESSRISTPDKQLQEVVLYDAEKRHGLSGHLNKLHAVATLRYHNVRRLSRSLDHVFQDGEDIFSVYHRMSQAEDRNEYSSNSRLVEILREENSSLKKELETYYQRVRKLQKIEQEVEGIREAHRILEASTVRREGLEKALRVKLEQEIWRLKEESIKLKAELSVARKQTASDTPSEKNGTSKREIRRRDTMIMRLIKQNQEAAMAREKLEEDLHSTKAQLKENHQGADGGVVGDGTPPGSEYNSHMNSEHDSKTAILYSESIDKLKAVLSAMHNMSQKRENLEKKLRFQLEGEIRRLKKKDGEEQAKENIADKLADMKLQNAALESDVVKWEHKCLELVAEKQMTFEVAVIPKEARIAALERALAEKIDTSHELRHQKAVYLGQLTEANHCITELEIKLTSVQSSLHEKDSVIQMMQKSFLEPEEDPFAHTPPSHLPPPPPGHSTALHHAPPHSNHSPAMPPPPPYPSPPLPSSYSAPVFSHNVPLPPPPHHYFPDADNPNSIDGETAPRDRTPSGSYVEVVPFSSPQQSNWSVGPSPRSPGSSVPLRTLPLGGAAPMPEPSYRSKSLSPVKALGGSINGMKPKGAAPGYSQQEIRRNGYTQRSPPTSRYFSNSVHQHGSNSSSAPNSPNVKSLPRKPRISHPNMRLLQVPASDYTAAGGYRPNHTPNNIRRKCNTGPGGTRRNYKPLPSPRAVKSKTPPPDYRLVTVSGGRGNNKSESPKLAPNKQRHHSVEDIVSTACDGRDQQRDTPHYHPDSLELFQSLIGDSNMGAQNRGGLASSMQLGGSGEYESYGGHQHSKSSPSNNFNHILLS